MANFWKKTAEVVNKVSETEGKLVSTGVPLPAAVVAGTSLAKLIVEITGGIIEKRAKKPKTEKTAKTPKKPRKPKTPKVEA